MSELREGWAEIRDSRVAHLFEIKKGLSHITNDLFDYSISRCRQWIIWEGTTMSEPTTLTRCTRCTRCTAAEKRA